MIDSTITNNPVPSTTPIFDVNRYPSSRDIPGHSEMFEPDYEKVTKPTKGQIIKGDNAFDTMRSSGMQEDSNKSFRRGGSAVEL